MIAYLWYFLIFTKNISAIRDVFTAITGASNSHMIWSLGRCQATRNKALEAVSWGLDQHPGQIVLDYPPVILTTKWWFGVWESLIYLISSTQKNCDWTYLAFGYFTCFLSSKDVIRDHMIMICNDMYDTDTVDDSELLAKQLTCPFKACSRHIEAKTFQLAKKNQPILWMKCRVNLYVRPKKLMNFKNR